jgi:hypothetical protein
MCWPSEILLYLVKVDGAGVAGRGGAIVESKVQRPHEWGGGVRAAAAF